MHALVLQKVVEARKGLATPTRERCQHTAMLRSMSLSRYSGGETETHDSQLCVVTTRAAPGVPRSQNSSSNPAPYRHARAHAPRRVRVPAVHGPSL